MEKDNSDNQLISSQVTTHLVWRSIPGSAYRFIKTPGKLDILSSLNKSTPGTANHKPGRGKVSAKAYRELGKPEGAGKRSEIT